MASPEPGDGNRAAGRTVALFAASVIALVLAAGIAVVVRHGATVHADAAAAVESIGALAGPPQGSAVAPYVAARRAALRAATGPTWALVSFTGYDTASDARRVATADGLTVAGWFVDPPGGGQSTVAASTSALSRWAAATRRRAASDAAGIRTMLPTIDDQNERIFYASELTRLAILGRVDPRGRVVFGMVARADAAILQNMAQTAGVRLVDPISGSLPALGSLAGLRPEEQVTVGTPVTRPLLG